MMVAAIWLLHEILLPFVAGMALAYLLDPLANRIERLGVNRFMATFLMIGAFALATGLASFVPYVGSFSGLIVAFAVAIVQFWPNWLPIISVLAVCAVLQMLESYVLSPYLVGPSVGLHPVWLMFALFAFGYLFGFVGLHRGDSGVGGGWCTDAVCDATLSGKPFLFR